MKNSTIYISFALCSILVCFLGVMGGTFAQSQFEITLGGTLNDHGYNIVQTTDGGYAVVGVTRSFDAQGVYDGYIAKFSSSGSLQWSKIIRGSGNDVAEDIVQTTDGGFVVCGYTQSFGGGTGEAFVTRFNSNGTLEWFKTYGGTDVDRIYSIIQTTDGGFAACGYTGTWGTVHDCYMFKITADGTLEWTTIVGGAFGDYAWSIVQDVDGSYAMAGSGNSFGQGTNDQYLIKLSAAGQFQWMRTVGGPQVDEALSILRDVTDGGFVLGGYTSNFYPGTWFYLTKFDRNGSLEWTKVIGDNDSNINYARDITQVNDGGFVLAGKWNPAATMTFDAEVAKINGDGTLAWNVRLGGEGSQEAYGITKTSDGGCAITGYTSTSGPGGNNFYIAKLDSNGNTCSTLVSLEHFVGSGGIATNPTPEVLYVSQTVLSHSPIIDDEGILTTICNVDTTTPVELSLFGATVNGNTVNLNWTTASETNNKGFEVERKAGSRQQAAGNWENVGFVEGNGTTTETKSYIFTDKNLSSGSYTYRLKQTDFDGTYSYSKEVEAEVGVLKEYSLEQNYPNPFNPTTKINYIIPEESFVTIKVYDVLGREVTTLVNEVKQSGNYEIEFSANELSTGLYIYRLQSGNEVMVRKMMVLK